MVHNQIVHMRGTWIRVIINITDIICLIWQESVVYQCRIDVDPQAFPILNFIVGCALA